MWSFFWWLVCHLNLRTLFFLASLEITCLFFGNHTLIFVWGPLVLQSRFTSGWNILPPLSPWPHCLVQEFWQWDSFSALQLELLRKGWSLSCGFWRPSSHFEAAGSHFVVKQESAWNESNTEGNRIQKRCPDDIIWASGPSISMSLAFSVMLQFIPLCSSEFWVGPLLMRALSNIVV